MYIIIQYSGPPYLPILLRFSLFLPARFPKTMAMCSARLILRVLRGSKRVDGGPLGAVKTKARYTGFVT